MEKEKILQKAKIESKRTNLNYLGFHKFIGMYLIIRMHIYDNKSMPFDFGIRMCEFLFISSGFLVGYNYYNKPIDYSYKSSFKYAYKHLRCFYPYYLLNLFYGLYFYKSEIKFNLTNVELLLINILLIANWSSHRKIARFYFGISWFLDNIFYCYCLSNFLLNTINNLKNSLKLLFFTALARILAEEFLHRGAFNVFDTNFHCGPIIRIIEFYIGMLISPLFFHLKKILDKFQNNYTFKIFYTIAQITLPIYFYCILVKYEKTLLRCYFVLFHSIYLFIISYDYGYISTFLSNTIIKTIMSAQLEMYLIQINIHITIAKYIGNKDYTQITRLLIYYIKLMLIFTISYFYRRFLRNKLAYLMDKIIFSFI